MCYRLYPFFPIQPCVSLVMHRSMVFIPCFSILLQRRVVIFRSVISPFFLGADALLEFVHMTGRLGLSRDCPSTQLMGAVLTLMRHSYGRVDL